MERSTFSRARARSLAAVMAMALCGALAPVGASQAQAPRDPCGIKGPSRDATPPRALNANAAPKLRADIDRCVRLNEIQVIGTHNSYHVEPLRDLLDLLLVFDPQFVAWEYEHAPLTEQFSALGIRQIELDVFADPDGGLYSEPVGDWIFPVPDFDPQGELLEPGYKVLHVQDLDFRTTCYTLVSCLTEVRDWSRADPAHVPLAILVEVKDEPIIDPLNLGFVIPIPVGTALLDDLDAEIRSVFSPDEMITPDDVRGSHPTLAAALQQNGWPTLGEARGKVLFLLDNGGGIRSSYMAGRPTLEGRVMFTSSEPPSPAAGFVKLNNPISSFSAIRSYVEQGLVVRTRADGDTVQARTGDTTQRDAALASGAQWVSTDYPVPNRFGTDYIVTLPWGDVARCNPVRTWTGCRSFLLE